ncbi:type II secretion system protein M [Pseudomonas sp. S75]|uniref:type II secretion system protein GspM n=1 Tax=unclassified Pseudomonas TaxID=196821 RepID=UPI001902E3B4|nr:MULTISPECIES: type II secretion system protein GspM [unclassified Pseudomonas]MBJ9975505.1 type II secretion system protein M [Pseudomonas sp. S30]MBK0153056.1 type II secretion system protein M [Pseudomonas sp. S75]
MSKHYLNRWRGRWQHFKTLARAAWLGLAVRERRLIAAAAALLGGWLCWLVLIEPPLRTLKHWQAETPKLRAQSQALERLLDEMPSQPGEAAIRHTLDTSGLLGHYQLTPLDKGWQLTFDAAPADAVIGWLLNQPRQCSLEVVEARLQRASGAKADDMAGALSGTVRMDQARSTKEAS